MLPDFDDDSASLDLCERGGTVVCTCKVYVQWKYFFPTKDKDVGISLPRHLSNTWAPEFHLDALNSASRSMVKFHVSGMGKRTERDLANDRLYRETHQVE